MPDEPKKPYSPLATYSAVQSRMPSIKRPQFMINAEQGTASEFHKRLTMWIKEFEAALDEEHEVGTRSSASPANLQRGPHHLPSMTGWP